MTKKLINRALIISIIISLVIFLKNTISHLRYCEIDSCRVCEKYTVAIVITMLLLIVILAYIIFMYLSGDFDDFFEKYTDPKLKKLCDFLNRRNGGCNEK
jgi:Mn2+/Fe2+ NRAMP family transporter